MAHRALCSALLLLVLSLAAASAGHDAPPPRYKILVYIPVGGSSHSFDLLSAAGALAKRHDVTVVTNPEDLDHAAAAVERLGDRAGPIRFELSDAPTPMKELASKMGTIGKGSRMSMVARLAKLPYWTSKGCRRIATNQTQMEAWRSYDALMAFNFPPPGTDSCPCLLAHALGVPLVLVRDMHLHDAPLDVPQFGSGLTKEQVRDTWAGRLKNAGHWAAQQAFMGALGFAAVHANRATRAAVKLPLGRARSCEPLVEVVSGNWLFMEPQPLQAWQVMVGAISPHPSRPEIPDAQIAAFAADAAAPGAGGFILVSFGSMSAMFGANLDSADYTNLALAFADLAPVRVLWQLSPKALPAGVDLSSLPLGDNTLVVPWAPVNDVLGHEACLAFVTHCGLKSTYEAMFHGVPIVGVPFMSEQLHNARTAAARGFGVVSEEAVAARKDGQRFSREGVTAAVRQVLSPKYASAARAVGEAMRLAYRHKAPVERAAEEIEVAMAAHGAPGHGSSTGGPREAGGGAGRAARPEDGGDAAADADESWSEEL